MDSKSLQIIQVVWFIILSIGMLFLYKNYFIFDLMIRKYITINSKNIPTTMKATIKNKQKESNVEDAE